MKVLAVDVGGTHVKILATGHEERRRILSGPQMTPALMVSRVKELAGNWDYDVVSIGYPGRVVKDRPVSEPNNLGPGWFGFDFAAAFGCPVKVMNDAAMQALGHYRGGTMLFLGLGTGLGTTLMVRGHVVPIELGALAYRKGTIEDYLGRRGLEKRGRRKWQKTLGLLAARLTTAFYLDDFVLGGGNAKELTRLPPGCRLGNNANAFLGGFRMWERAAGPKNERPKHNGHARHRGAPSARTAEAATQ